jgi:putative oxidoreductase
MTRARWARWLTATSDPSLGLLVLRLAFGLSLALAHGLPKLLNPAGLIGALAKGGFPLPEVFGWAAIGAELVGGLLLAIGLLTKPAAALVLTTMAVAVLDAHAADPFRKKELALAYGTVALVLLFTGPGRWAVDARLARGA